MFLQPVSYQRFQPFTPKCSLQACVLHYLRADDFKFLVIDCIQSAIDKDSGAEYVSILSNKSYSLNESLAP